MAITPTGSIYKALQFDGVSSRSYGVYITGSAVFNAPERDVEMITIPGRNGAFALDNGHFQNIEVSYPAGIYADNEEDFAEAISEFRNYLCSKRGYCRLQDEYNPDEYRLAIYKSGLEVEPAFLKAGEFTITFECKPQRFLTSGETKQTIATSGDTITNPTLFKSGPLLEIEGYGTIGFNGYEIELNNETFGDVTILSETTNNVKSFSFTFAKGLYNLGDTIEIKKMVRKWVIVASEYYAPPAYANHRIGDVSISDSNILATTTAEKINPPSTDRGEHIYSTTFSGLTFTAGTYTTVTDTITASVEIVYWNGGAYVPITTETLAPIVTVKYESLSAAEDMITFSFTNVYDLYSSAVSSTMEISTFGPVVLHSTVSMLGNPTYIDCDIGEAYKIENDNPISLNQYIDLGSKLPTLAPGSNAITFDNTITDLKVTPRWWRV